MAIWAISLVGIGPIFDYIPSGIQKAENGGFLFLVVINAVVAVWAGTGGERIRLYAKRPLVS